MLLLALGSEPSVVYTPVAFFTVAVTDMLSLNVVEPWESVTLMAFGSAETS